MKKNPRFERYNLREPEIRRNKDDGSKYCLCFHTINIEKEERRKKVALEVSNRFCANADEQGRLPTNFRMSAFDLFSNLQMLCGSTNIIYRTVMRITYRKILKHIRLYFNNAEKQYQAGYVDRPNFLK